MQITNIKINGIRNPIGYDMNQAVCSFLVEDTAAVSQIACLIEVSADMDFEEVIWHTEDAEADCTGVLLDVNLEPYMRYYVRIAVTGDNGEQAVGTTWFETGKRKADWEAEWICTEAKDSFHPLFRKKFQVQKQVRKARLYICGLGLYEAYINGEKISDEYLTPYFHDYNNELQYQTYDITGQLGADNMVSVLLGKGWYMGRYGLEGTDRLYGDRYALIAELHLTYTDGTSGLIKTDESWEYCGSDIEDDSIYDGEIYNRCLWSEKNNSWKTAQLTDIDKNLLMDRQSVPVCVKEDLPVKELLYTPAGEWVLDMGQNFTGYIQFQSELPRGTRVVLDFGEVLQDENFYRENYRSAKSQFTYISNGERETVRPHFTFFGFRYVRITGWPGEPEAEKFTGKVIYSDLDRTGYFECSDERINRLYENTLWSQKSNFVDIPTDCPQRDERMAWTGDAQVFSAAACYHMDCRPFYRKFLHDLRNEQVKMNGGIPNYFPNMGELQGASAIWGDAAAIIPDVLNRFYYNKEDYISEYEMMKDWVDYVGREGADEKHLYSIGHQFGDWLALDGITEQSFKGGTDDTYLASVYYCGSARLVAEMAERLGRTEDAAYYAELAENIKAAVLEEYFTAGGRLSVDTQAAYLTALRYNIYSDKEKLLEQFRERLRKDGYKIRCGFAGAPVLCQTLAEHGLTDLAYHFLFQEGFPGWLGCVELGATTIWERWNSMLEDGTVSGTGMNSFNHYAYGSVAEFLYAYAGGIREGEVGFRKAVIAPAIDMHFRKVNCSYQSVSGTYSCEWEICEDGQVEVQISIPFNCTAKVYLPEYEFEEMELQAGKYCCKYYPKKDFRNIYSEDTLLKDLVKDDRAVSIMNEYIPAAVYMGNGDEEGQTTKLGELRYMFFLGFKPEQVDIAINKIKELVRW